MKTTLVEAWRLIVPLPNDRHGPLAPLLLSLTFFTGLVDAFSYLALGRVFVANMTGNVVFLAFALAGSPGFSLPASILALAVFSLGAFGGGRLISDLGDHRGHLLTVASTLEVILVAGAMIVALVSTQSEIGTGPTRYILIALLSLATGLQNATARKLAVPDLTTTVLTLTITGIAADSQPAGGTGSRLGRRGLSVLAMFLGAAVGSVLVIGGHASISLVLALLVLGILASTSAVISRGNPSWARAA
jgi:uncharacterized membrane protein YoaK (UPF0700 family)